MSERMVAMNDEQAALLDELTQRLMREGDLRAMNLGTLVIAFKFAKPIAPPLPANVVAFPDRHSLRVS